MTRSLVVAKLIADIVVNAVKLVEDQDISAVILKGVRRSIQLDLHSCGAHSVHVILRYYGMHQILSELTRKLRTNPEGTSTNAMRRILHNKGLTTTIIAQARLKDLRKAIAAGHPVIFSARGGEHWAVAYGYSPGHIFVADSSPTAGLHCRFTVQRFRTYWDNWMMTVIR
jgi:ABC-type bacteriocin/lantibiotic exporter with double-glycine peptidase domain